MERKHRKRVLRRITDGSQFHDVLRTRLRPPIWLGTQLACCSTDRSGCSRMARQGLPAVAQHKKDVWSVEEGESQKIRGAAYSYGTRGRESPASDERGAP